MIFTQLELENFGLYAGRQQLDLSPGPGRPVILIGGANGAGKTTILDAFTLCLHGRRALGPRVSNDRYEEHVRSRLHAWPNSEPSLEAAVGLSFEHVHRGRASTYKVERRWRRTQAGRIREVLSLSVDGTPMDDVAEAAHQEFLDSLLPPGLAGFFLFDGEKIQSLADDDNGEHLADAIRRLLGLDLIDQLRLDLRRFAGSSSRRDAESLVARVGEAESRVRVAAELAADRLDARAALQARRDQLVARIARIRDRLAREGGTLADQRGQLEREARSAAAEVAAAEEELRGLIAGLLPFAIAQDLADRLDARLRAEHTAEEDEIVERRLRASASRLRELMRNVGREEASLLDDLRDALGVSASATAPRLHDISSAERAVTLARVGAIRDSVRVDAARLSARVRSARETGERADAQLEQVPDDAALAPLIEELQEAERSLGSATGELDRVVEQVRLAERDGVVAERELRRAQEAVAGHKRGERATDLALRTSTLLEEYGRRTEASRLTRVEDEATCYFNRLSRKGELLARIRIDRESFRVVVERWDGTELPKERLSAGEKQLMAIAILWALAKASDRPLPVVVDTPLARLDLEHRRRLLTEYLPHVSHQVVVLSTDTEIDLSAAAQLAGVTARTLYLEHDPSEASTRIEVGYFAPEEAALAV